MGKMQDNKNEKPERLSDKIHVPSSRLMVLLPILGIASMGALVAVIILGIMMLETLTNRAEIAPNLTPEFKEELDKISGKTDILEKKLDSLDKQVKRVTRLANELYLEKPTTEEEKEKARLAVMPPSELILHGLKELVEKKGQPAAYFESIIEHYPDSPETAMALYQLGVLKVRNADYDAAIALLERYLDEHGLDSKSDAAKASFFLGLAFHSTGMDKRAAELYESAAESLPQEDILRATSLSNLGEVHINLGNTEAAKETFTKLIGDFERDERASNMVKRAKKFLKKPVNK